MIYAFHLALHQQNTHTHRHTQSHTARHPNQSWLRIMPEWSNGILRRYFTSLTFPIFVWLGRFVFPPFAFVNCIHTTYFLCLKAEMSTKTKLLSIYVYIYQTKGTSVTNSSEITKSLVSQVTSFYFVGVRRWTIHSSRNEEREKKHLWKKTTKIFI